jgi:hypothetical protein
LQAICGSFRTFIERAFNTRSTNRSTMGSQGRRLTDEEEREIRRELAELRQEHRDLDLAIAALAESGMADTIRIQRMKKRKLVLKDRIAALEDRRLPDIIA